MNTRYLIRLDDACQTMDRLKWLRMEYVLDKYEIKPMVGVIPLNDDPHQKIAPVYEGFWTKIKEWENKGWSIALHGYNHCYVSKEGLNGLNPMWKRSEFAGLSLEKQREKIRDGVAILRSHDINPMYFFAPSHTFDENTLVALMEESDIRIISDTIALRPYRYGDFVFIPQFSGKCREMIFPGVYTFCLHPSSMTDIDIDQVERFLDKYYKKFISFADINIETVGAKTIFDRLLSWGYFFMRKIRFK